MAYKSFRVCLLRRPAAFRPAHLVLEYCALEWWGTHAYFKSEEWQVQGCLPWRPMQGWSCYNHLGDGFHIMHLAAVIWASPSTCPYSLECWVWSALSPPPPVGEQSCKEVCDWCSDGEPQINARFCVLKLSGTPHPLLEPRDCCLLQGSQPKQCEQFWFQSIPSLCQHALSLWKASIIYLKKKTKKHHTKKTF